MDRNLSRRFFLILHAIIYQLSCLNNIFNSSVIAFREKTRHVYVREGYQGEYRNQGWIHLDNSSYVHIPMRPAGRSYRSFFNIYVIRLYMLSVIFQCLMDYYSYPMRPVCFVDSKTNCIQNIEEDLFHFSLDLWSLTFLLLFQLRYIRTRMRCFNCSKLVTCKPCFKLRALLVCSSKNVIYCIYSYSIVCPMILFV